LATPPPQPQMMQPPGPRPSMAILAVITALAFVVIALIYLWIFIFSGIPFESACWWAGLVGFIFAFVFFMVHAASREEPISRIVSVMFFVLGAVFFYSAILLGGSDTGSRIFWLIVLSILVMVILLFVWRMSVQKEADDYRRAMRKRTP